MKGAFFAHKAGIADGRTDILSDTMTCTRLMKPFSPNTDSNDERGVFRAQSGNGGRSRPAIGRGRPKIGARTASRSPYSGQHRQSYVKRASLLRPNLSSKPCERSSRRIFLRFSEVFLPGGGGGGGGVCPRMREIETLNSQFS